MYYHLLPAFVFTALFSYTNAGVISSPPANFLRVTKRDLLYDAKFLQSYQILQDGLGCLDFLASASVEKRDFVDDYAYDFVIDNNGNTPKADENLHTEVDVRCASTYVTKRDGYNYDFGNFNDNPLALGTKIDPWAIIGTPNARLPGSGVENVAASPVGNTIIAQGNADFSSFNTPPGDTSDATLGPPPSNFQAELAALQNIPCNPHDLRVDLTLMQILGSVEGMRLNCQGDLFFEVQKQ